MSNFQFLKFDFSVPKDVANFYFNDARLYRFFVTNREFHTLTTFQIATKWLFASKINALFNLLTIAVMAISPANIYKFYNKKSIWIIYLVTVIQMFFLIFSSPIFRFFIHLTLFFIFLIFASWLPLKKYIMSAYTFCTIIIIVVLFVPISFSGLTKNKLISKNSNFSIQNIVFPHNNTKTEMQYEVVEKGNLKTIKLKESINTLDTVVITAGTFDAGEKARVSVLKPLDILTTAGNPGDIVSAFKTLLGTQVVGESGKLFVRGGEANETQTFIDGIRVAQPYIQTANNVPTRSTFSAMLFKTALY